MNGHTCIWFMPRLGRNSIEKCAHNYQQLPNIGASAGNSTYLKGRYDSTSFIKCLQWQIRQDEKTPRVGWNVKQSQ